MIPAQISKSEAEACYQYAEQVCKVLGLDLGVFHVEIMITPSGPVLVEANPRAMGGMMMTAYECATGADFCDHIINLHLRRKLAEPLPTPHRAATVRKIIPRRNSRTSLTLDLSWLNGQIDIIADEAVLAIAPDVPIERLQTIGRYRLYWCDVERCKCARGTMSR